MKAKRLNNKSPNPRDSHPNAFEPSTAIDTTFSQCADRIIVQMVHQISIFCRKTYWMSSSKKELNIKSHTGRKQEDSD